MPDNPNDNRSQHDNLLSMTKMLRKEAAKHGLQEVLDASQDELIDAIKTVMQKRGEKLRGYTSKH